MAEILSDAVDLVNLPFTVLLALVVFYWGLVALGALDSTFGSDVHAHADTDASGGNGHAHHDSDSEGSGNGDHEGWLSGVLHFINVGDVPLMVALSILSLFLWIGSMIANQYFTDGNPLLAAALFFPNLLISAVLTRYFTLPLKPVFRMLRREGEDHPAIVGQFCRILTTQATDKFGQAEIETKGAPLLIDVRTMNGIALPKGASAVVVREDLERGIYFIAELPAPRLSS